jgi:hypothetical protein
MNRAIEELSYRAPKLSRLDSASPSLPTEQLRQLLGGLKMHPTAAMPTINFTKRMLTDAGRLKDPSIAFAQYVETVTTAAEELAQRLRNVGKLVRTK